jgi:hypothetical protein
MTCAVTPPPSPPDRLTRAEFDTLTARFERAEADLRSAATTRDGQARSRAAGAGHPHRHDARGRLLMALLWRRVYPTDEVLGLLLRPPQTQRPTPCPLRP